MIGQQAGTNMNGKVLVKFLEEESSQWISGPAPVSEPMEKQNGNAGH
jgi:hypothetical protein